MSYAERKDIYTEKIHHLTCGGCKTQINTADSSHGMDKEQAVAFFKNNSDWIYRKGTGWLCLMCQID